MPFFEVQTKDGRAFEVEAPDYDSALQAVDGPTSWGDVTSGYAQNFASDAAQVGKDTLNAITHPIETGKQIMDLGVGAAQHGYRYFTDDKSPPTPQMDVASGFVQGLKDDYGNTEKFKRSLRDKPVQTTMDLLLPLSLARTPIAISKGERLARHRHTTVAHNETKATKLYDKADKSGAQWSPQEYNSLLGKLGAIPARFKGSVGLTPKSVSLLQQMAKGRNAQNNIDFMMSYRRLAQAKQKEALRAGNDVDATIAKEIKKTIDAEK